MDIVIEDIYQMVSNLKVYETDYAWLWDKEFDYLSHPTFENIAAMSEEITKSSQELSTMAQGLQQLIEQFKV